MNRSKCADGTQYMTQPREPQENSWQAAVTVHKSRERNAECTAAQLHRMHLHKTSGVTIRTRLLQGADLQMSSNQELISCKLKAHLSGFLSKKEQGALTIADKSLAWVRTSSDHATVRKTESSGKGED